MFKNVCIALIGIWFIFTPWIFHYHVKQPEAMVCTVLGVIQVLCALLALGKTGKKTWQNWITLITGICFIIYPNMYDLDIAPFTISAVLGFITLLLSYSSLYPDEH